MIKIGITTTDNPYHPFKDFDRWFEFDCEHNYLTCELLARLSRITDEVSDDQNAWEKERAIDLIVDTHPTLYKKVVYDTTTE